MSTEQLLIGLIGIISGVTGWFARRLYDAVEELKDSLNKLEVHISSEYVRYDRLQDALKPLMAALDEIKQSLNHKADKT